MFRRLVRFVVLSFLSFVALAGRAGPVVDSVGITVGDLDRSVRFYGDVLGFTRVAEWEEQGADYEHVYGVFGARVRVTRLALGAESIELRQFLAPQGRPIPADSRSNDRWFQHVAIIVSDMDRAYATLRAHGVAYASTGPQTLPAWNEDAGGIAAFYFRDPDGHNLEVLHFPPGKGDARWQATDRLFLGIDHTAIVVASTEYSLHYYRDVLGMRIAGTAENYGPEQERLNNVFGVRLRITALRAERGIGVELLDYLAPRTGRAMPSDTLASDLWHWQVAFARDDLDAVEAIVVRDSGKPGAASLVSPGVVAVVAAGRAASRALTLRDPDGHADVLWTQPPGAPAQTVSSSTGSSR
jgi:catechol 2,3-dioxygenase-like lactoylglutathione lyase family enzyme